MASGTIGAGDADLELLVVDPAHRRRGWGRMLLAAWEWRAALAGANAAYLEVSAANGAARALYARSGYASVGVRARFYADGCDAVLMRRALVLEADAIQAALLAGGRGLRLGGRAKPLLRRADGVTLVEAQIRALRDEVRDVACVAPADRWRALRVAEPAVAGLRWVNDAGRGPGRAVGAAARALDAPWLAWTAADVPRPDRSLWRALRFAAARPGCDAAVIESGAVWQVGCGVARREPLASSSSSSLQGLLQDSHVEVVAASSLPPETRTALEDLDRPDQLHRLETSRLAREANAIEDPDDAA